MVSINDHPDIRRVFAGFEMLELDIRYSVGNAQARPATSRELAIMNWSPSALGQLFYREYAAVPIRARSDDKTAAHLQPPWANGLRRLRSKKANHR